MLGNAPVQPPEPIDNVVVRDVAHVLLEGELAVAEVLVAPDAAEDVEGLLGAAGSGHGVVVLHIIIIVNFSDGYLDSLHFFLPR